MGSINVHCAEFREEVDNGELPRTLGTEAAHQCPRTDRWEAATLITSLITLTVLPKEGLRSEEAISLCLSICFFSCISYIVLSWLYRSFLFVCPSFGLLTPEGPDVTVWLHDVWASFLSPPRIPAMGSSVLCDTRGPVCLKGSLLFPLPFWFLPLRLFITHF